MNTLKEEWDKLERLAVPKEAGQVQRREMRRAFYAGASAFLNLLDRTLIDGVSEEAGSLLLEGWQSEIDQFGLDVRDGRA